MHRHFLLVYQAGVIYALADLGMAKNSDEVWADINIRRFILRLRPIVDANQTWLPSLDPGVVANVRVSKHVMNPKLFSTWKKFRNKNQNFMICPAIIDDNRTIDYDKKWQIRQRGVAGSYRIFPAYTNMTQYTMEKFPHCDECFDENRWCYHTPKHWVEPIIKFHLGATIASAADEIFEPEVNRSPPPICRPAGDRKAGVDEWLADDGTDIDDGADNANSADDEFVNELVNLLIAPADKS